MPVPLGREEGPFRRPRMALHQARADTGISAVIRTNPRDVALGCMVFAPMTAITCGFDIDIS